MNKDIAEKVFGDLFRIPDGVVEGCRTIMVNFNSLLSAIFYKTLLMDVGDNDNVMDLTYDLIRIFSKEFMDTYSYRNIIFYYRDLNIDNLKGRAILPTWHRNKNKDISNETALMIYNKFIDTIKKLESLGAAKIARTLECEEEYIPTYLMINDYIAKEKTLIVSRAPLDMLNCMNKNFSIWNGKYLYDTEHNSLNRGVKYRDFGCVTPYMLPAIMLIAGVPKNGYKGVRRYGIYKAIQFMIENKVSLKDIEYETDDIDKEKVLSKVRYFYPLFNPSKYLEKWGMDITYTGFEKKE